MGLHLLTLLQPLHKEFLTLWARVCFCLLWITALNVQSISHLEHPVSEDSVTASEWGKPGSRSEVLLLGSGWHNKSVVDGGTEADCDSVTQSPTTPRDTAFSFAASQRSHACQITKSIFLFKAGLDISILYMAWMFSPLFATQAASYYKSWLTSLLFPWLALLCPQMLQGLAPCFPLLDFTECFLAIILLW